MTGLPSPGRWQRIAPILERALDLPPAERAAFLDGACRDDPELREPIEDLLRADLAAASFLGAPVSLEDLGPAPDEADGLDESSSPGVSSIGLYRVVREIGRGGMGVVYEAEQQRPRRPVALKVILGGRHVDATTVRMFQREADSLARLRHPAIAAIYESGATDEGQHYLAMELVRGPSLSIWLDEAGVPRTRQDLRRRLALFRRIAGAVAYAHQRGVIHRDLKPSNILVVQAAERGAGPQRDDIPDIKVLDFGLARIIEPGEAGTAITELGRIQGTLPYMSPEQVRGRRDEVDVRSDVYALGVILYRMLAGRLPYDLEGADYPEAARIICEAPPRPLADRAARQVTIDRDLVVIVLKALEKDPGRRYATVAALDEDVTRYLGEQPILARPPSAAYQMRKLVARHKAPFAAAGVALVLLLGFAVLMAVEARRIAAERDRANREAVTAVRVSTFLTDLFKVSDPNEAKGNAITAREILDKGVEKIGQELANEPVVQARLMQTMGDVYSELGLYKQAQSSLEQSLSTRRRLLGEENLDTLASMESLAILALREGRAAESEKDYLRIIETRRRLEGGDHPDTLRSMAVLAYVYEFEGRQAEAEDLRRRVLDGQRRALGEDSPITLNTARGLAHTERMLGHLAEAEALTAPTLEKQRRVLGPDHPDVLASMTDLADLYKARGRYAESESLYKEALRADRRVFGDDHPQTLHTMADLAVLYGREKRWPEEEGLLLETIERLRRTLGENHENTLTSMNDLACVYVAEGRHAEARTLFLKTLDGQRRSLGEDHPDTLLTLYNLGCLEARDGNRRAAFERLNEAVAHGFARPDEMRQDSDLESLHGDPRFAALIARAREQSQARTKSKPAAGG